MSWMQTHSGGMFDFADPEVYEPTVEEVAHALSNICRYNGHCQVFYSVAEHASRCASLAERLGLGAEVRRAALHHDDAEAYVGDVVRPLKMLLEVRYHASYVETFSVLERQVEERLRRVFKIVWTPEIERQVKDLDNVLLHVEKDHIMGPPPEPWHLPAVPEEWLAEARELACGWSVGWSPHVAERNYLAWESYPKAQVLL